MGIEVGIDFKIKSIKQIPYTKKDIIYEDIKFIEEMLRSGLGIPTKDKMEYHYIINDETYRAILQDKLMGLIEKYLTCK